MIWRKRRIYADAAAATPLSKGAKLELFRLLGLYGNPSALHQEAVLAKAELDAARQKTAEAIGAHSDEIVFTSGGTEGNNLAITGVLRPLLQQWGSQTSLNLGKSDFPKIPKLRAITSSIEHASVLEPLRALKKSGLDLVELPVNSAGLVSLQDVAEAITDETVFISIQFVNSEIGTIQPIREIAKEVRRVRKDRESWRSRTSTEVSKSDFARPLYIHTDASQAPLWKRVQVEKLGVDLLTLDGQKIMGPKGVGALFVRRGVRVESQQLGGGQERGLRGGTENVPLAGSFAVALEEAQMEVDLETAKRIAAVRNFLLKEILQRIPDAEVNGAVGDYRVANNLNISIPSLDGEMAVIALDALGVAASTRSACDQSDEEPSHVLVALGLDPKRIKSAIRLTLLPNATLITARRIAQALLEVSKRYRA